MTEVKRIPGDESHREGFYVETEAGGKEYRYHLLITEQRDPDADDEDERDGTVTCIEKRVHDTETDDTTLAEPEVTDAVRRKMEEYGFAVE